MKWFTVSTVLVLLVSLALALPLVALAAPPSQGAESPTDALSGLLSLLLSLVAGGAIAYLLDDFPLWRDWKPEPASLKQYAVVLLTVLVGAAIVFMQQWGLPRIGELPVEVQLALGWAAIYLASQIIHEYDLSLQSQIAAGRAKPFAEPEPHRGN